MGRLVWIDHDEMKTAFKKDVVRYFGPSSLFIPNELRIPGLGWGAFQSDGFILTYDITLTIFFAEFKPLLGIKDRKGTFFQLAKYNIPPIYQRKAFVYLINKLKSLGIQEFDDFIVKNWGSFNLFCQLLEKMNFKFETCLLKEGADSYFIELINSNLHHVIVLTYDCESERIASA
jgi:hypothetical protein